MSGRAARIAKVLSHPHTLLLAGALVTSIVVPAITRSWQDHEKQLAVKSRLVEDMTEKTSKFLAAIQVARVKVPQVQAIENFKAANDAHKQFLVDSAVLSSRLSTRFRDTSIAARWRAYSRLVVDLCSLGGPERHESDIAEKAHNMLASYQRTAEPLSEEAEAERTRLIGLVGNNPGKEWAELYGEALGQRDAIVQAILDADEVAI